MPKITVLPHEALCPDGAVIDARSGQSICDALLDNHIEIEHACGKCGACSTCHVIIRKGFSSLSEMSEKEEDMLDRAWGLEAESRLSCQAKIGEEDVTVEIPKYNINLVSENR